MIDIYITDFNNYVGISSCSECGMYMLASTWTEVPLTPYTPTPIPPTSTPYIPTPNSTTTPTLAPYQVTLTPGMFERLYGTHTPTALPSGTPTIAPTPSSPASMVSATSPTTDNPSRSPLVLAIGLLMIMVGLMYLIWLTVMRPK